MKKLLIECGRGGTADALGWGPSGGNPVEVQVLSAAPSQLILYAPVAQLDRASDYGSEGCGFDSCRARQFKIK